MAIVFSQAAGGSFGSSPNTTSITINVGDTVVVTVTNNSSVAVSTVADSGGSTYVQRGTTAKNGTLWTEIWSTSAGGAIASTSVTVTMASSVFNAYSIMTYTGALALGTTATPTTGSSTASSIILTTQDANNFVVAGMGCGTTLSATWSASVGNLRTSQASSHTTGALGTAGMDNTATSATSVTNTATLSQSDPWAATALELRSVSAVVAVFEDDSFKQYQPLPNLVTTVFS